MCVCVCVCVKYITTILVNFTVQQIPLLFLCSNRYLSNIVQDISIHIIPLAFFFTIYWNKHFIQCWFTLLQPHWWSTTVVSRPTAFSVVNHIQQDSSFFISFVGSVNHIAYKLLSGRPPASMFVLQQAFSPLVWWEQLQQNLFCMQTTWNSIRRMKNE